MRAYPESFRNNFGKISNVATVNITHPAGERRRVGGGRARHRRRARQGGRVQPDQGRRLGIDALGRDRHRHDQTGTNPVDRVQNGKLKSSDLPCDGTATQPKCVVATVVVDAAGAYSLDRVSVQGGPLDPNDPNTWGTKPTVINVFSSSPMLGGSKTNGIEFK
jgi:hypothetical protein